MSVNLTLQDLLDVQAHFGLPSPALVEKDFHVARALAAIAAANTGRLRLVFSGGTALGRAHKLIQRMSEDIDLKIVADPVPTRAELRQLRDVITNALLAAGFAFDPDNPNHRVSRNNSQYTLYRLPYAPTAEGQGALRPEIHIETALWPVRLPTVEREVRSFYAEAFQQPAEVAGITCVSIPETAAEKFVALTRRVAAEQATPPEQRDQTLARHIYDLHVLGTHTDLNIVTAQIPIIMQADAEAYGNQFPPYRTNPIGETQKALHALASDPAYAQSYAAFLRDMVYGESIHYYDGIDALITVFNALEQKLKKKTMITPDESSRLNFIVKQLEEATNQPGLLSPSRLAEAIGEADAGDMKAYFEGSKHPTFKALGKISGYLGARKDWLAHGEAPIFDVVQCVIPLVTIERTLDWLLQGDGDYQLTKLFFVRSEKDEDTLLIVKKLGTWHCKSVVTDHLLSPKGRADANWPLDASLAIALKTLFNDSKIRDKVEVASYIIPADDFNKITTANVYPLAVLSHHERQDWWSCYWSTDAAKKGYGTWPLWADFCKYIQYAINRFETLPTQYPYFLGAGGSPNTGLTGP